MDFAGIDDQGQYATALPKHIWDPTAFPPSAYKEELAKSQQEILKRKEEEKRAVQRQAVDFVPASGEGTGAGSSGGGGGARVTESIRISNASSGRSAAERIMAGLDRERSRTPNTVGSGGEGEKRRPIPRRG